MLYCSRSSPHLPSTSAAFLTLTIHSELWPSSKAWRGARWLVGGILFLAIATIVILWSPRYLVFNNAFLHSAASIATYIDFALIVLVALDIVSLVIAEGIVQMLRRQICEKSGCMRCS